MGKYEVIIKELNNNNELSLTLEANEVETMENIIIQASVSEQQITSINYNYFSAYQKFRDQLLQLGYGIKCNGSRINAVQSDMMVATDKIYLVELGKQAYPTNQAIPPQTQPNTSLIKVHASFPGTLLPKILIYFSVCFGDAQMFIANEP